MYGVMIKENLLKILNEIKDGNCFNEKVTLVGATKFVDVNRINEAILAGLKDIGENKAQEFRDKFDNVLPVNYHFFGRLQKNKVKYLIGKAFLIHSVDSIELLEEISKQSQNKSLVTNVLIELNLGEEQKGGISTDTLSEVLKTAKTLNGVCVKGLMAVLPDTEGQVELKTLFKKVRALYDEYKVEYAFEYLSLGMSNDYKLAIECGSNMIRVGTKIFGARY